MKSNKLLSLSIAAFSLLGVFAVFSFSRTGNIKTSSADEIIANPSFDGETLVDPSELSLGSATSTSTDYGVSYSLDFSTGGTAITDIDNNYGVVGYTSDLIDFNKDLQEMTAEQRTAIRNQIAAGELETTYYQGYIISIDKNKTEVVLPRTLSRGEYQYDAIYTVNIDAIGDYVLEAGSNLKTLWIPNTIKSIPANALADALNLETIYVEFTESQIPDEYEDGWSQGAEVIYGANIYGGSRAASENASTISTIEVGDENLNFIIGYFPTEENSISYPLTVEYKLVGDDTPRFLELEKVSTTQVFDGVGKKISGFSNSLNANIDFAKGEAVDFDSIIVHNIFAAEQREKINSEGVAITYWAPILTERYYAMPKKMFKKTYSINDFMNISFSKVAIFNGYTAIDAVVDKVKGGEVFKEIKPSVWAQHEADLKSGRSYIRYRLTSLSSSKYRLLFDDKNIVSKVTTPVNQFILKQNTGNNISFVFKDSDIGNGFNPRNLKAFALNNAVITLDVVQGSTIIARTAVSVRFGSLFFMNENDQMNLFDCNLLLTLIAVCYSVGAIILGTVLFFVFKNKYKNDEFRRLKPKSFIKKGIIYWICSLVLVLAITFIVIRCTVFNNAIVVYNPVDIFIILFSIAGVIIVGYFIKTLIVAVKANKARKNAIRLGIDKDVAKDGTN